MTAVLLLLELQVASPCAVQGERQRPYSTLDTIFFLFWAQVSFYAVELKLCLLRVTAFVILVSYGTMHIFLRGPI